MPTYKTPDVYVEEISLLPRSVAEVETAVPAFIGYTESANFRNEDLLNKPTLVRSLVEFEEKYGVGPQTDVTAFTLDATMNVSSATFSNNYFLYEAMRMFYQNGGGKCYIVSVGTYKGDGSVVKSELSGGLAAAAREDEPTLLVIPDGVSLTPSTQFYDLQREMLAQAGKLKDRFAILDLREDENWTKGVTDFRNQIGTKDLSYGAAYTPHLKSSIPRLITYREVKGAPAFEAIKNLADAQIRPLFDAADAAIADSNTVKAVDVKKIADDFTQKRSALLAKLNGGTPLIAEIQPLFLDLLTFLYTTNKNVSDRWAKDTGGLTNTANRDLAKNAIKDTLKNTFTVLNGLAKGSDAATGAVVAAVPTGIGKADAPEWGPIFTTLPDPDAAFYAAPAAGDPGNPARLANVRKAEARINGLGQSFITALTSLRDSVLSQEWAVEKTLLDQYPTYSNVVRGIGSQVHEVPPSGAVVGAICYTDRTRGVWKAPANISLDGVAAVSEHVDSDEQADLNVDANAGKSINAIRPFTGRGILVWGARTLAGNDNEWRYVNVRRFFIMVEESLRKSTLWAVFESNDANLWVKIKGMISNYLTEKWREGALAGAKPEHAFFVNVGLGVTMTPQDILEGRLIVEVGMAVVRPAEFIVIRFSHKLQQS